MSAIAVSLDSELVGEIFLRTGPKTDVAGIIEYVVWDYLERTAGDEEWSEAYREYKASAGDTKSIEAEFGDPKQGYQWSTLFLPNGTHICMEYRREKHYAAVKHGSIVYEDDEYSPSELARMIANNTSRNAWRDLMIKRPQDTSWTLADVLRNQKRP